jgi:lipopolysaccharide/colanic/teichoic acid biosynthesis glycosyltransferase
MSEKNAAKRAFDLCGAAVGLVVLLPLFAAIALAITVSDGGPVFFRQVRVGRNGRPFKMLKFRTMVPDAERLGGLLTVGGDPRVTPMGAWLRRHKLDELPQLLNVLVGDMSLVGPRPEVPKYVALYTPAQRRVLDLTPGITDPGSLAYVNESELLANSAEPERTYVLHVMPDKLRRNLEYAAVASVWTDLGVILSTVRNLVRAPTPDARPPLATRGPTL